MNKQRKVLITITYNEMGIIIDTKAEEVAQPNLQPTCNQLATDTISRQAAIDAVTAESRNVDSRYLESERIIHESDAVEAIAMLPPTQPEPKRGRWIKMSDADGDYYCCDQCGEELPRYMAEIPSWDRPYPHKQSIDKTDFCPNCGADMRGEQDE